MDKRILAYDFNSVEDLHKLKAFHSNPRTEIIFRNPDTKEVLFKTTNKVVGAGGDMVARKLYDIALDTNPIVIPTYNDELGIPDPGPEDVGARYDFTSAKPGDPKVLLFCIGTDGCGTENSQIFAVDYNSRIAPDAIVPFRYPMASNDLSDELQELYAGRKEINNETGSYVAYYFKRFTSGPDLHEQYLDGTPIESNVYEMGQEFEIYVETTLMITKDEAREFFIATSGIDQCRFNTMSLLYAYPRQVGGKLYFMDVRPLTKLNISNESLIDVTKGVEIIYHTYF